MPPVVYRPYDDLDEDEVTEPSAVPSFPMSERRPPPVSVHGEDEVVPGSLLATWALRLQAWLLGVGRALRWLWRALLGRSP